VRAEQDWHEEALRTALASGDEAWRLTAVFCMRYVRGFDEQILEALNDKSPAIRCEAVMAAGEWGLDAAWPQVSALITSKKTDKPLLIAAIEAVASIRPLETPKLLEHLADSEDEDIAGAVAEALDMAEMGPIDGNGALDFDDEDDDELDEDDELEGDPKLLN
jgi:HEAT repeat protein